MTRPAVPAFAVALPLLLAACTTAAQDRAPSSGDFAGEEKIRFKSEGARTAGDPGVVDYAMVPFENVAYFPWKILGSGAKGAADGVGCGFTRDRMPLFGVIFAPVNLVAGLVTGMAEGAALSPMAVGPTDDFGHAMAQPTRHATTIWWYE